MVTVDRFLRFTPDLSWMFPGVVRVYRSARAITVRGWSTGYRLPKPDDLAIKSGSVFLYRYDGRDSDGLLGALAELERKGTGLRREEGLGQVAASWPFHVELGGTAR
jgi:CRISPR-associated protein Csx10